jgi:hypothetical protein
MKKGLILFLSFILIVSLTGCGNSQQVNTKETAKSSDSIPESKKVESVTIDNALGTRKNPAKVGDVVTVKAENTTYETADAEIELLEVQFGEDAKGHLTKDLIHIYTPKDGYEFVMAKFRIKNIKNRNDKDYPFKAYEGNFIYVTGEYKKINEFTAYFGEDGMDADLYEGAEHSGWILLQVEKGDSSPKVLYSDTVWFNLK